MRLYPKVSGLAARSENCATMYSCIAILWVSLVSFAATNLCVASQRVFMFVAVVVYFVMDTVRKLLDTASYLDSRFEVFTAVKSRGILGSDAVYRCGRIQTFRRAILRLSSDFTLKIVSVWPSETFVSYRNTTWHHNL
jgi:hypothetical protein